MVYQAPIVACGIGAAKVLNVALTWVEKKCHGKVPLFLHYYTWLYIMLFVLFITSLHTTYSDVMSSEISDWLDPDQSEANVKSVMRSDHELDKTMLSPEDPTKSMTVYEYWKEEADLRDYPFLRFFSMLSPLWVLSTFVVCAWHTTKHVQKVAEKKKKGSYGLVDSPMHDLTIFILALPLVYGLMSFKSVIRCWQISINHVGSKGVSIFEGFLDRRNFLDEMYEANFMVGDIYETLGLIAFGHIISTVLKQNIKKADANHGRETSEVTDHLVVGMGKLTVSGVQLFCTSCMLQGVYTLVVTYIGFEHPGFMPNIFSMHVSNPGLLQTPLMEAKVKNIFLGFGFAASWAAIGNIMTVEQDFHHFLDNEEEGFRFNPSAKFWGTKLLVTLAFLQSMLLMVIPPFSHWKPLYVNLFYSTVLCFECFIIAIMHVYAWNSDEEWYRDDEPSNLHAPLLEAKAHMAAPKE